jgi:hypothetical protein
MIDIMVAADAHPMCRLLAQMPLDWAQPSTSSDPKYLASGVGKVHVELLGLGGLVRSDVVRLGGATGCCPTANTAFVPIRQKRCS